MYSNIQMLKFKKLDIETDNSSFSKQFDILLLLILLTKPSVFT